jgi:2-deoxy-scyllo-inosamine dehydrogenase (SAM-dependent)
MFDYRLKINRISFELSNLCHYAPVHKKCPLHLIDKPIILPKKIIYHVLDTVSSWGYRGKIGFHTYNEPGIDPRLFMLILYARDKCPDSYIMFMSNGYYIDENLLNEYKDAGVDEIFLSAYSNIDYIRFASYKTELKLTIQKPILDDRLDIYDSQELMINMPCLAPYNELMITREGYVGLCCLDWKREEVFGDLNQQTLEEILKSEKMVNTYNSLSEGRRISNICKRCDWSR